MKNIQENIYRVKSIMGLLTETEIIEADPKGSDPYEYKKEDGKFYITKIDEDDWKEVTDTNVIKSIKEKYIPDTLTIDSPTKFTPNQLKFWTIFLRDYKSFITHQTLYIDSNSLIYGVTISTTKDGVDVGWGFKSNGQLEVSIDNKYQTATIVDDKIVLQDAKFSDLLNPENPDRPDWGEKEGINPKEEYIKFNVFSALADDIYRDLIEDKISNVSLDYVFKVDYNDNNELKYINFSILIDNKSADLTLSDEGVVLKVNDVQVKPIWDNKILKYRPFNSNEKKTGNEWMKTQVELKLEHFKNRFKQLI